MKEKKSIKEHFKMFYSGYPIEITFGAVMLLLLSFFSVDFFSVETGEGMKGALFLLVLFSPYYFLVMYCANCANRLLYYFSALYPLLGTLFLFFAGNGNFVLVLQMYTEEICGVLIIQLILFFSRGLIKDNKQFVYNALSIAKNLFLALGVSFLLGAVLTLLITGGTALLFDLSSMEQVWNFIFYFHAVNTVAIWGWFTIIIFLWFEYRQQPSSNSQAISRPSTLQVVVSNIFSAVVCCYSIVLVLYLCKILFLWELPQGEVSYVVIPYVVFGTICVALGQLETTSIWRTLHKHFSKLALVALILLWIATIVRINAYGLSVNRIGLLCLNTTLTLYILFSFSRKLFVYRNFSIVTIVMVALFTIFLPSRELVKSNQHQRFISIMTALNGLDEQGKIKSDFFDESRLANPTPQMIDALKKLNRAVSNVMNYSDLVDFYGGDALEHIEDYSQKVLEEKPF